MTIRRLHFREGVPVGDFAQNPRGELVSLIENGGYNLDELSQGFYDINPPSEHNGDVSHELALFVDENGDGTVQMFRGDAETATDIYSSDGTPTAIDSDFDIHINCEQPIFVVSYQPFDSDSIYVSDILEWVSGKGPERL